MTTTLEAHTNRPLDGGIPARRAVTRWAWRMFRREWRQQLLILALIALAVAATTVGVGVSTNTPLSSYVGFGTARDLATFPSASASTAATIAQWHQRYGAVEVIDNQTVTVPGTIETFDLRSQSPEGAFGRPLLALVSGHFPTASNQVAVTSGVAADFNLKLGASWRIGGTLRRVVGIVENPQNLLDEFALVQPGQVTSPSQVTALFDAPGVAPAKLGRNVITPSSIAQSNIMNPQTISIVLATMAMLLIALVAVAGFTVVAQRRLRSIGMLGALGATDKGIRLVVRANGAFVGVVGALVGLVLGLAAWLAYRPILQSSAHHVVGVWQLPWAVILVAVAFAVLAAYVASTRPARAMSRLSSVAALSGRPAPPRKLRRSAVPGIVFGAASFFLLGAAGASGGNGGGVGELLFGFISLTVAVVLLAPFLLTVLAGTAHNAPFAIRLAMRDLARYRARSGAALGAISVGVLIAMVVIIASAARFGNVMDYAGPNVASTQLIVYTPNGPYGAGPGDAYNGSAPSTKSEASMERNAHSIARALDARQIVTLESTSATLQHAASGRSYSGPLYVATPKLLSAFGIPASSIQRKAEILSMRPGFASISNMQIIYGNYFRHVKPGGGPSGAWPCPKSDCLANPVMQEVSALPAGTSAPNTVITEYAVKKLGLQPGTAGWLIETARPLSAAQLTEARSTAAAADMRIETKSSIPTSATIINWATLIGVLLALGVLALSIGLIRSETAGDVRVLAATGASSVTRRNLTAATAGALALIGAVTGTAAAYVAMLGFSRTSAQDGISSLASVPVTNLLLILVAMPAVAAAVGWIASGRVPPGIAHQPIE